MEKFNILEFNKNKVSNQYSKVLDNGTVITQFEYPSGYVEKIIPQEGWHYTFKEFYLNGFLKKKGDVFKKGEFQSGIWYECDEEGKIIKETDYDKLFKLTVDELLKILKVKEIHFDYGEPSSIITRNIENTKAVWIIEWKEQEDRRELLYIDDQTGDIIKKDYYIFQTDN